MRKPRVQSSGEIIDRLRNSLLVKYDSIPRRISSETYARNAPFRITKLDSVENSIVLFASVDQKPRDKNKRQNRIITLRPVLIGSVWGEDGDGIIKIETSFNTAGDITSGFSSFNRDGFHVPAENRLALRAGYLINRDLVEVCDPLAYDFTRFDERRTAIF